MFLSSEYLSDDVTLTMTRKSDSVYIYIYIHMGSAGKVLELQYYSEFKCNSVGGGGGGGGGVYHSKHLSLLYSII